jgi:hypothetical protein
MPDQVGLHLRAFRLFHSFCEEVLARLFIRFKTHQGTPPGMTIFFTWPPEMRHEILHSFAGAFAQKSQVTRHQQDLHPTGK